MPKKPGPKLSRSDKVRLRLAYYHIDKGDKQGTAVKRAFLKFPHKLKEELKDLEEALKGLPPHVAGQPKIWLKHHMPTSMREALECEVDRLNKLLATYKHLVENFDLPDYLLEPPDDPSDFPGDPSENP